MSTAEQPVRSGVDGVRGERPPMCATCEMWGALTPQEAFGICRIILDDRYREVHVSLLHRLRRRGVQPELTKGGQACVARVKVGYKGATRLAYRPKSPHVLDAEARLNY